MAVKYTDCVELKRLIVDKKLKVTAVKNYLRAQGIFCNQTDALAYANSIYTIFFGSSDITNIANMITSQSNYEKSMLVKAKIIIYERGDDPLAWICDEIMRLKNISHDFVIGRPIIRGDLVEVEISYNKKRPARNKLIEYDYRRMHINIRKISEKDVVVDIRQSSTSDCERVIRLLSQIGKVDKSTGFCLHHINLNSLTIQRRVNFFDQISSFPFSMWHLETITGITVKKEKPSTEDDEDDEEMHEQGNSEDDGVLAGISQAILNGNGLRTNEFIQNSVDEGFFIVSMKYRFHYNAEPSAFIIAISGTKTDLRIDIEKTYYQYEDDKYCAHPMLQQEQDIIIQEFQNAANQVFSMLFDEQQDNTISN